MSDKRWVRASSPAILEDGQGLWLLGADQAAVRLDGDSAQLVLTVLDVARRPVTQPECVSRIVEEAGGTPGADEVVADAFNLLVRLGALAEERVTPRAANAGPFGQVVVGVSGAVAAAATPALVERLLAYGNDVRVVMTRAARRFVAPRALAALTHRSVTTTLWKGSPDAPAPHIELARWADLVLVDPCSATTLARIVAGDCSDVVAAVATTTRAPVLLAPSMNLEMLRSPAVAHNLEQAVERGFFVAHPGAAIEVADAPDARSPVGGGAPSPSVVARFVRILLERAANDEPKLATTPEWDTTHAQTEDDPDGLDQELASIVFEHSPTSTRLLDVGTGLGSLARAAARRGHVVVATDFSPTAIERAAAVAPDVPVAWIVDDATASSVRGAFDVCVDRGCLGCIPASRRDRYIAQVAAWLRRGGLWIVKTHAPQPRQLRAHGFAPEGLPPALLELFEQVQVKPSAMRFGASGDRPGWTFVFRRKA